MDHDCFDDLTRTLTTSMSRRQALKLLGGSLAGGLLAFLGVGEAAADDTCKRNGKTCKNDDQCCGDLICVVAGARTNSPKKNSATCQEPASTCVPLYAPCPTGCTGSAGGLPCAGCCGDPDETGGGGLCYSAYAAGCGSVPCC